MYNLQNEYNLVEDEVFDTHPVPLELKIQLLDLKAKVIMVDRLSGIEDILGRLEEAVCGCHC